MKHAPVDLASSDAPSPDRPSSPCVCAHDVGADHGADHMVRALIADELEAIREVLEEVGMHLCIDPVMIERYSMVLQGIDELAQRNENLARILRAGAMEPAIQSVSLESLRSRLLDGVAACRVDPPAIG